MEYIMYAVHLLALVLITVVAGGLLNHADSKEVET